MTDIVLVTGASGFVGAAVARAALARGYRTRVLMRPTASRANIAGREVVREAHEQVQRTCENDERRELGRAAGPELIP